MKLGAIKSMFWVKEFGVLLFFSVLVYIYFFDVLVGPDTLLGPRDSISYIYEYFYFFSQTLKDFALPLWDPHVFSGIPISANPTWGLFYPLNYVFWFFPYADGIFPYYAYDYLVIFHIFLAGWFMYLLGKSFGFDRFASVCMGIIYMFNATILCHVEWVHSLSGFVWVPLIFLFVNKSFKSGASRIYALFGGLFLGIAILSALSGRAIQVILIIALFCAYMVFRNLKNKMLIKDIVISSFLIMFVGFLISAISILPILEYLPFSLRFIGGATVIGNEEIPIEFFVKSKVSFTNLLGFILPQYSKITLGSTFFGIIPLCLSIFACVKLRRNYIVSFFFFLAVFSLIYSMAIVLPYIFHEIPFLDKIRQPQKYVMFISVCIPVLAGFSLNYIFSKHEK